jgi:hypothetical protein
MPSSKWMRIVAIREEQPETRDRSYDESFQVGFCL